jgi:hypothetical protein
VTFPPLVLEALRVKHEVDIETRSPKGEVHRVTIWIVVAGGVPYVRSVRAEKGRWFRELMRHGEGAVLIGRQRVPVRASLVKDAGENSRVSDAIQEKYDRPRASVLAMIRTEVIPTTARLEPPD